MSEVNSDENDPNERTYEEHSTIKALKGDRITRMMGLQCSKPEFKKHPATVVE